MGKPFGSTPTLPALASTPAANPPSGSLLLYFKSDGKLYKKTSAGVETEIGSGGGDVSHFVQTAEPTLPPTGAIWQDPNDSTAPTAGDNLDFAVDYVETSNVTGLATKAAGSLSSDGYIVTNNQIVLLTGQTASAENGVYVQGITSLTRHPSFTTAAQVAGSTVRVKTGTSYGGSRWNSRFKSTDTVGTTGQPWYKAPEFNSTGDLIVPNDVTAKSLSLSDIFGTIPLSPIFGIKLYERNKGRKVPAFSASGDTSALQTALYSNRICSLKAINAVATQQLDGLAVTNIAAPTAISVASTNFYTGRHRHRYTSAATAGAGCGTRSATAQWYLSSTANDGGFWMVCRFGLATISATNRVFVGMSSTTAALNAAVDPSTLFNLIGFGADSADANLQLMHNDASGVATKISLGASFPTNAGSVNFYEVSLYAAPGAGQDVDWQATRLNDTAVASGTITTNMPAVGTLLSSHIHHSNGTTAAAVALDLQQLYLETDS